MTLDDYLANLDLGYFEVGEAFKGLPDNHVWKRPTAGLLSIGELTGHIAYWEAVRMAPDGATGTGRPDASNSKIKSPLVDQRFAYYSTTLPTTPTEEHLTMTAQQVHQDLLRVHEESVTHLKAQSPDLTSKAPWWGGTFDEYLKYAAFHIAYHTGQMYSVRHLLGEETPDN